MTKEQLKNIENEVNLHFKTKAKLIDLDTIKIKLPWIYSLSNKSIGFLCYKCSMLELLDVTIKFTLLGIIIIIKDK